MTRIGNRVLHRGMSLIELCMAMAIGALVITGTMASAGMAYTSYTNNDELSMVRAVEDTVHHMFAGQANYNTLTSNYIATSGQISARYTTPNGGATTLISPNKQIVNLGGMATAFTVNVPSVSYAECTALAVAPQDVYLSSVRVNGTAVNGRPMTPTEATANCTGVSGSMPYAVVYTYF